MTPAPSGPVTQAPAAFWRRGRVRVLTRAGGLFCFASITFLLYAISPEPAEETIDVSEAALRPASPAPVKGFPPYRDVIGAENSLFSYRQAFRAPGTRAFTVVRDEPPPPPVAEVKPKPEDEAPPPPPAAPPPDLTGLVLIATFAEPDGKGMALIKEDEKTFTVSTGETLRKARVDRIEASAVVVKSGDQEARLETRSSIPPLVMKPFRTGTENATIRVRTESAAPKENKPIRKSLGISIAEVSLMDAQKIKTPVKSRVRVQSMSVSRADVKVGDFLVGVNGTDVRSAQEALKLIREAQAEDKVRLRFWRDGKEFESVVKWRE